MDKQFEKQCLRMCYVCQLSEHNACSPLFEESKFTRCGACGKVFCGSFGNIGDNLCHECRDRIKMNVSGGVNC